MRCPKCESEKITLNGMRFLVSTGESVQRYRCSDCKMSFVLPGVFSPKLDDGEIRSTVTINKDKSIYSDKIIEISEQQLKDASALLLAHGFDPERWELISATNYLWHAMRKNDLGRLVQYQSKILAKPRNTDEIMFGDIDKFFSELKTPKQATIKKIKTVHTGRILEICLADLHIGKMDVGGNNVDSVGRCEVTLQDIAKRIVGKGIEKIYFVPLGDTFHYDGSKHTSGGTLVEGGMDMPTVFDIGAKLLIWSIDLLSQLAPVEVIGIYGNHDRQSSYMLFKSLEFYYRNSPNVLVDASHLSRKFRKFGNNLVLWNHGDMAKRNAYSLIQREARKEFGETKYAEIHSGHFHSQQTVEKDGVIIRYLPTTTPTDVWHYENGYTGNIESTTSFLWDKDLGLREIWYSNL